MCYPSFPCFSYLIGSVWFVFLRTVFCSQNQGHKGEHVWFLKTLNSNNKNRFKRTLQNDVLCILKNCSQEQFSSTIL